MCVWRLPGDGATVPGFLIAVLAVLGAWWLSTGVILYLDARHPRTFLRSLLAATAVLIASFYGIVEARDDASVAGAYISFLSGLGVWAWLEMSFLMGFVTGPRKLGCSLHCSGWRHFVHAIEAILYHELAIMALAAATVAASWRSPNQIGTWTFLLLWAMRSSAKLNLFLGVRNLSDELLPAHLMYLKGFFRKRPMNFLFPLSVTAGTIATTILVQNAAAVDATDFRATGFTLLATLSALGVIEHWILVLPFPATMLWNWSVRPAERESVG
jgi:putative photosynthetic complex assembly protein 2